MSQKQLFPPVPLKLIEELEARFPNRLPSQSPDPAIMSELIGQQQIIGFLRREFNKQNDIKERK